MKREIKFLLQNKETGEIYGTEKIDASGDWQHTFQGETKHCQFQKEDYGLLPSAIERRQYTGLKDKNGKEIYEGDIVKFSDIYNEKIVFEDGAFRAYTIEHSGKRSRECILVEGIAGLFKIIGNIYENPELLNGKA